MVVEQNSRGRIFIDSFEVKRICVNFIRENFDKFECIDVKAGSPKFEIVLKANEDYRIDRLDIVRNEIIAMFKERVHLDIKQLDITIL